MSQKKAKVLFYVLCSFVLLAVLGFAEDAKPVPDAAQNKLLKAQHAVDEILSKEKDAQIQFSQAQATASGIQASFPLLQKQQADSEKALQDAKDEALKAAGLDKAKYDVDIKAMTFPSKTPTAPVTPSPEKK